MAQSSIANRGIFEAEMGMQIEVLETAIRDQKSAEIEELRKRIDAEEKLRRKAEEDLKESEVKHQEMTRTFLQLAKKYNQLETLVAQTRGERKAAESAEVVNQFGRGNSDATPKTVGNSKREVGEQAALEIETEVRRRVTETNLKARKDMADRMEMKMKKEVEKIRTEAAEEMWKMRLEKDDVVRAKLLVDESLKICQNENAFLKKEISRLCSELTVNESFGKLNEELKKQLEMERMIREVAEERASNLRVMFKERLNTCKEEIKKLKEQYLLSSEEKRELKELRKSGKAMEKEKAGGPAPALVLQFSIDKSLRENGIEDKQALQKTCKELRIRVSDSEMEKIHDLLADGAMTSHMRRREINKLEAVLHVTVKEQTAANIARSDDDSKAAETNAASGSITKRGSNSFRSSKIENLSSLKEGPDSVGWHKGNEPSNTGTSQQHAKRKRETSEAEFPGSQLRQPHPKQQPGTPIVVLSDSDNEVSK